MSQSPPGCELKYDCSACIEIEDCEDVEALAVTRAKGKTLLQWDEHKKVRQNVARQIEKGRRKQNQGSGSQTHQL